MFHLHHKSTISDHYPKRPVYGCPLADHLRYAKRDVSIVLEVCCSALCELGLREEVLIKNHLHSWKHVVSRAYSAFPVW